ncbi:MAG: B12-binding domain-containing radical SAM protein [Planctomycetes bacterium]|nr:B12-binding domain-containing radical SAM protein [Planctomycetota bacterium]
MRFVSKRAAFPPLGLLTVAAMLPKSWNLRLVDMDVTRLRDADLRWADYVMVSAMIVHKQSIEEEVIPRCQRMGRTIIGGGPLFTTGHEEFAGKVHAVLGECEEIIADVIHDMETGHLEDTYQSGRGFPDVTNTPVPRWDLVRMRHYATMSIQFSRGCPFDCEFCDITVMNGRKSRNKTPDQMLIELDALVAAGWKGTVFFVDDNFIGNKRQVKEFLRALVQWRARRKPQIDFITEASVNLADDKELLALMVPAGFRSVFLGIETPVPESLKECQKVQNTHGDLAEMVRTIQRGGLQVMGGFIVGFDHDPREIFQLQFDFIQKTGIAVAMVGLLTALPKTRLYQRLLGEGRLDAASTGNNTEGVLNFHPKLDREFLINGYARLMRSLYEPATYYQRVLTFLAEYRPHGPRLRLTLGDLRAFGKSLWIMGVLHRGRLAFWKYLATVLVRHPRKLPPAIALAIHGFHYRMVAKGL